MAKKKAKKRGLTEKQKAFVREYLGNGRNATEAYQKSHPRAKRRTCEVEGHKHLRNPEIKAALERHNKRAAKKLDITREKVAKMYLQAQKIAEDTGQASAINGAAKGLAALYGLEEPAKSKVEHQGGINIIVETGIERLPGDD